MAAVKNLRAAAMSLRCETDTSITWRYWSSALYTYDQTPETFT
jgi:hypothetical protein